jgi:hypothetical protein
MILINKIIKYNVFILYLKNNFYFKIFIKNLIFMYKKIY